MSKAEVIKICPTAICGQDENGRFYIFDDRSNPVFPYGHSSAKKAWSDLLKHLANDKFHSEYHSNLGVPR